MNPDRFFDADPAQRTLARQLYQAIASLPLVCPHGHVEPRLFVNEETHFANPTEMFVIPDHYVFRMLYSQGVSMEDLGIPRRDGAAVEGDPRRIWQRFADHFYLFRGTPTGVWLRDELEDVFGITLKLTSQNAQAIYDQIDAQLAAPEFRPRRLYERFNIEVLCTTDAATDTLAHHQAIRASGWSGHIRPTFRPDAALKMDAPGWRNEIDKLSDLAGVEIDSYEQFVAALESRRAFFKQMGATATDHAVYMPNIARFDSLEALRHGFVNALRGRVEADFAARFELHMLWEMARMSREDGLVMQLHVGSLRDHNRLVFDRFGPNMGGDIPAPVSFTAALQPFLNEFGNDASMTIILFTLDETTYGRELAPLVGHYPALRLGPPWWFFDSLNGMRRYFDAVIETAGLYNTAGFNDDTRAFPSIPARHDTWRRAAANWLAGQVVTGVCDEDDAAEMAHSMAYGLAKKCYRL